MKKISYRMKFALLVVWIFVVIGLFRVIDDRKVAATIAGLGFLALPILILVDEVRLKKLVVLLAAGQFLLLFAIPIFLLRILNWDSDFATLDIAGVPSGLLHKYSNVSYIIMVAAVMLESWRERRKKRQLRS